MGKPGSVGAFLGDYQEIKWAKPCKNKPHRSLKMLETIKYHEFSEIWFIRNHDASPCPAPTDVSKLS